MEPRTFFMSIISSRIEWLRDMETLENNGQFRQHGTQVYAGGITSQQVYEHVGVAAVCSDLQCHGVPKSMASER